jgi:ssDNA-binding Zn-finger/Zn-ribbon topoisomerase 1
MAMCDSIEGVRVDEERELLQTVLEPCPTCGSEYTSVRFAKHGWYYVGCMDCENKTLCDASKVHKVIKRWNDYGRIHK